MLLLILFLFLFFFVLSFVWLLPYTHSHLFSIYPHFVPYPLSPLSSRQRSPSWECDRSYSLLCCIAFARRPRETPVNSVSSLWTSRSVFRCVDPGPTFTHPSTDWARICSIWVDRLIPNVGAFTYSTNNFNFFQNFSCVDFSNYIIYEF